MKFKLVCFDMDGVIFEGSKNRWISIHEALETLDEGVELTKKYLKTDYQKLVEEVVHKLWKGKDASPVLEMISSVKYMQGVRETVDCLRNEGVITAIVSSGVKQFAERAQKELRFDYIYANEAVIENNKFSGEFIWPMGEGTKEKVKVIKELVKELGIKLEEVVFIGDETVDIEAMKLVGLGIAFNADKEEVKKAADLVIEGNNLKETLKYILE